MKSFLGCVLAATLVGAQVEFNCDPCIERSGTSIQAIVHGASDDTFWMQVQAAMKQSASDMNVEFSLSFAEGGNADSLYDNMASQITQAAGNAQALIVSIPEGSDKVKQAVETVISGGTPVFGLESGYQVAKSAGLSSFIGMDDELAGKTAAENFKAAAPTQALFLHLTDAANAQKYSNRVKGLQDGFAALNLTTSVESTAIESPGDVSASGIFDNCPYQAVLIGTESDELMENTWALLDQQGCQDTLLATFGSSVAVHKAVSSGKLAFAMSQQSYLQGALSVVHAALYVTTGKHLAPSSESPWGMLLSGPEVFTADNVLTDTFQICEAEGFPVCPNDKALDGVTTSECKCTDRPTMKIAGVLHAVTTDSFWDIVYTAANQAADDFGVLLELDRMEPDTADVLHTRMANQIERLCQEGVDGIFVTIPSETVLDAIKGCQQLNVPVVSINAGPDFSRDLGLQHHLGMVEFNAGYLAGQRMAETGQLTSALCCDHAPGNVVLIDRCGGFEKAMKEANIPYLGAVTVPDDNAELFVNNVETFVRTENNDDYSGLGVMLAGGPQHGPGIMLKEKHPEILAGAFDTSDAFYKGLDDGKLMFGMDQGPYLQGYLPIPLLAWQAQTMQNTVNHLIETGPDFVLESPSQAKQTCELGHFKTCEWEAVSTTSGPDVADSTPTTGTSDSGGDTSSSGSNNNTPSDEDASASIPASGSSNAESEGGSDNKAAIVSLSIVAVVCILSIGFLAYRMHLLKKYVHRLEEDGRAPPQMSTGDYISSAYMPPEQIVNRKGGGGANEVKDETVTAEHI
ncbi:Periplasmic binding proteins and sugar binding domain of LacI family [Seminavis robusta]|uniref:Periplasmic binding proteins and sugar binding domain of LacI family n=1 Tax=Seminavis robusta TaxID=568900 RepID=A0A9N8EXY8_9STRA|nr:Periplasmic binding proteins and sugar binding domain of LacI family [Seminavis robusta]|eukprot:Sro2046_g312480.1 Periplasmic binding proteins and sugar binding domain of LacI family (801) ;mRNA; r:8380-10890